MFEFKGDGSETFVFSNLSIIQQGTPGKEAFLIEGANLYTNDIGIINYSVGYNLSNCEVVEIKNNFISLSPSPFHTHVRAGMFNGCKSIAIINNTVIFESVLNFEIIKEKRLVTYSHPIQDL